MSARELSTAAILLAIGGSVAQIGNDRWAPWQLLGQPCDPATTCIAARKKIDAELKVFEKKRGGNDFDCAFGSGKKGWTPTSHGV